VPKTHSIERLIDLLPPDTRPIPDLTAAAELTAYATVFRYPGTEEPISEGEYREALRLGEAIVRWAEACIRQS
jgi:HEPN domain-containing protein